MSIVPDSRPVDFSGRRNALAVIVGTLAASAAALLGSKTAAGSIRRTDGVLPVRRPESFRRIW